MSTTPARRSPPRLPRTQRPKRRHPTRWFGRGSGPFEARDADRERTVPRTFYVRLAPDDSVWLDFSDGTTRHPQSDLNSHEVILRSRSGAWVELDAGPHGYGTWEAEAAAEGNANVGDDGRKERKP